MGVMTRARVETHALTQAVWKLKNKEAQRTAYGILFKDIYIFFFNMAYQKKDI